MSLWSLVVQTAGLYGLLLSFVLTFIMAVSLALARDMWVGDYPPDIKAKYGAMTPRARRLRPYIAVPFFLTSLLIPLVGLLALRTELAHVPFLAAPAFGFLTLLTFNTYDLFVLDWLIFCTLRPRWAILPGTEGMPGYRNYRFHFIGFLKGLAFCAVGGLIIALIWLAIEAMVLQPLAA